MKTGAADEQLIRRAGFCVKQGSGIVRYYKKYVIFYMGTFFIWEQIQGPWYTQSN